jgi:DNA replication and repair protein RecF
MTLGRVEIQNVRNISQATLELNPALNVVTGKNGSGKTSLLESVYMLGTGRTFRGNSIDPLICRGQATCTVYGAVQRIGGGRMNLGVERGRDGSRSIRINGEATARASDLARCLPALVLGPHTVELLSGPPGGRRRFLNWGVFHVEPTFSDLWDQGSRCLRQRNELLRRSGEDARELDVWDQRLASVADQIHAHRSVYFDQFQAKFAAIVAELTGLSGVECSYLKGWEGADGLALVLERLRDSDRQRGYTQSGFHRADVRVRIGGENAASVCSRGELKILAWALVLSQGQVFVEESGMGLLYLVDDLTSELDLEHRQRVCRFLAGSRCQAVLTAIDRDQLADLLAEAPHRSVFHVEHGDFSVEEMTNDHRKNLRLQEHQGPQGT